ncbi:MAG: hypothetical protein KDJ87_16785, partial [Rhizobiaceae bacterium]|nr:hypothetical protein [Rhizobiaceae bacterium]
SFQFSKR